MYPKCTVCEFNSLRLIFCLRFLIFEKIFHIISNVFSPDTLITEIPPSPGGVEIAAIVESNFNFKYFVFLLLNK